MHNEEFDEVKMIVEMSKGRQITIPAEIRNALDLTTGSRLEVLKVENEIVIRPIGEDLDKIFKEAKRIKPKRNLNPKQMDELNEGLFR